MPKPAAAGLSGGVAQRGAPECRRLEGGEGARARAAGRAREQRAAAQRDRGAEPIAGHPVFQRERAGVLPRAALALEPVYGAAAAIGPGRTHEEHVAGGGQGGPEAVRALRRRACETAHRAGLARRADRVCVDDAGLRRRRLAERRQVSQPTGRADEGGIGREAHRAPGARAHLAPRVEFGPLGPRARPPLEQVGAPAHVRRPGGTDQQPLPRPGDIGAELVTDRAGGRLQHLRHGPRGTAARVIAVAAPEDVHAPRLRVRREAKLGAVARHEYVPAHEHDRCREPRGGNAARGERAPERLRRRRARRDHAGCRRETSDRQRQPSAPHAHPPFKRPLSGGFARHAPSQPFGVLRHPLREPRAFVLPLGPEGRLLRAVQEVLPEPLKLVRRQNRLAAQA